jgi:thiol-disulfide isomerase/thioredoxin
LGVALGSGLFVSGLAVAAPDPVKTLAIGAAAPDFSLPDVDGRFRKLSDYAQAKVLVIVFTCNHCPTAQAYEARIAKLAADYKDKGVALVAISPNDPLAVRLDELGYSDVSDSFEEMKIRAKDPRLQVPLSLRRRQAGGRQGVWSGRHAARVRLRRPAEARYVGRVDDNERDPNAVKSHDARNAIEAVLAGKSVPVETTKAVGCSIKWADKRESARQALEQWAQEPVTSSTIGLDEVKALLKNDGEKLRLINIWSIHCPPCVAEFPELVEINRMYRGRPFELVSVNVDGLAGRGKAHMFLKSKQASFTNSIYSGDANALISTVDPSWPGAIPFTLLIKPGGEVVYKQLGRIDPLEVKKAIVEVLGRTYK